MAAKMFEARDAARGAARERDGSVSQPELRHATERWAQYWHAAATSPDSKSRLCRLMRDEGLTRTERELVVLLLLRGLSIAMGRVRDFSGVVAALSLSGRGAFRLARSLACGRLSRSALLLSTEHEERNGSVPELSPMALEAVLAPIRVDGTRGPVAVEADLTYQLGRLVIACREKAEALSEIDEGSPWAARRVPGLHGRVSSEVMQIESAMHRHPNWYLAPVFLELEKGPLRLVVLLLAGKELGLGEAEHPLFTGSGLSRAVSKKPDEVGSHMRLLGARAHLQREGWIQPCAGESTHFSDAASSIAETEFELADGAVEKLKLTRRNTGKTRLGLLLEPRLGLDRLILPDSTRFSLQLALAQARHTKMLMQDWGLAEHIPYGTGITMLFYGPPGTGKTASAEAVAHELGKRLLVVDYTKALNCFVGNTEKNLALAFALAQRHDAVLFWDEADAMLQERERAARSWEISAVTVLLQELERFDGVCILASNRQASMDKALERRISLRIEFPFPDRATRQRLWEVLIPPKMPLASDVRLDRLAAYELSGGMIKNVVLNVARIACMRKGKRVATQADFERAVQLEQSSRLCGGGGRRIGFAARQKE